uniref:AT27792p n=1 Tax=Drosophila melanogaster TaxID=7227 RepID=Q8T3W4_DROME
MGGEAMEKSEGGDQPESAGEKEQVHQGADQQVQREKRRRSVSPDGGDVGSVKMADVVLEGASDVAVTKKRVNINHNTSSSHRHSCFPHKIDSHSADSIRILGNSCTVDGALLKPKKRHSTPHSEC